MRKIKRRKSNIMKIFLLLFTPLFIFAKVHYAKVEPYESVVLKSAVSALVVEVDLDAEGSMVTSKRVIHLDDSLDKVNLEDSKKSVVLLEKMLGINEEIATSLSGTVKRQEGYYNRISKLATASKTQKDNAYSSFISAKTQYLGTREKIISLEKQIMDMKYKVAQLKDSIAKKSLVLENKYLYKLMVRKGDFVNPGSALAQVEDASRAKLVLFLEPEELDQIEQKIFKTYESRNKVMHTACGLDCYDACSIIVEEDAFKIKGDASHPAGNGALCSLLNKYMFNTPRIEKPRVDGVEVSMDEALEAVAEAFKADKSLLWRGSGNFAVMQEVTNLFMEEIEGSLTKGSLCDGSGDAGIVMGRGVKERCKQNTSFGADRKS
jgi:hypothetical protein